jgi:hypothetical protein
LSSHSYLPARGREAEAESPGAEVWSAAEAESSLGAEAWSEAAAEAEEWLEAAGEAEPVPNSKQ